MKLHVTANHTIVSQIWHVRLWPVIQLHDNLLTNFWLTWGVKNFQQLHSYCHTGWMLVKCYISFIFFNHIRNVVFQRKLYNIFVICASEYSEMIHDCIQFNSIIFVHLIQKGVVTHRIYNMSIMRDINVVQCTVHFLCQNILVPCSGNKLWRISSLSFLDCN